jgi:hypothetical protein
MMAQNPPRLCPNCGTPAEPNQRFCAECGTTLHMASNQPTVLASGEQATLASQGNGAQFATQPAPGTNGSGDAALAPTQLVGAPGEQPVATVPASGAHFYSQTTDANPIPPPPPPDSLVAPLYQTPNPYQAPDRTPPAQPTPAPGTYSVPDYARAPKRSRFGLVVSLVLLLVLVLGAVAAYALFFNKGSNNKQGNTSTQNTPGTNGNTPASNVTTTTGTGNSTPGSGGTTPTATTSTSGNGSPSEQVNLAFTYASINITITNVEYATSFSDDNNTPGGVRVAFTENNPTSNNPNFFYSDVARLILPDQSSISPTGELQQISTDPATSRPNWLDFPVTSQPADLTKLVLQMGTATENQMRIPLAPGADLSKYQPKTVTPGTSFQYAGLNWTLKSATESLSAADKQATTGNVYIIVTLNAFNPTANDYSAYYGDIARLSAGGTTNAPTSDSTFPTPVASQASGTATLIFLVPQGSTAYTLVMLATTSSPPAQQVTVPFTIQ